MKLRYLSVCDGIGAAHQAFGPLGWDPVAVSEIDPFACSTHIHHRPHIPNWGDMTKFQEWPDARIDLLCGGTPCQSFSVAGLRQGLDSGNGQLMLTFCEIAARYRPRWVLWENVPGVLSSAGGSDFASLLGLLTGRKVPVPEGGWGTLGHVEGIPDAYDVAYRVLDAQYFGLAQRRKRVFVVGHLGSMGRPSHAGALQRARSLPGIPLAVLLEREGLRGDPAPRREEGQRITYDTSPSLRNSGSGVAQAGDSRGGDPVVAILEATGRQGSSSDGKDGLGDAQPGEPMFTLQARHQHGVFAPPTVFGGNDTRGPVGAAPALNAKGGSGRMDFESEALVLDAAMETTHSLRGEGFDASEDGTGRGTPIIPAIGVDITNLSEGKISGTLESAQDRHNRGQGVLAFDARQSDVVQYGNMTGPLDTSGHSDGVAVTFESRFVRNGRGAPSDLVPPLKAESGQTGKGDAAPLIAMDTPHQQGAVRRLTPVECSRLQGFPDLYLHQVPYRGQVPPADGPMYRGLGNSWAVPCVQWIGHRIELVTAVLDETKGMNIL